MNQPAEIRTIDKFNELTTTIIRSRFIAQVYSVKSEVEVKDYLANSKKKHYEASHHCYAYKLADGKFHYSDAGEPNGTAGIRIYNAIEHFDLSNQLVIVSRVFGGIKLGVGPLGKAYYESSFQVLNNSTIDLKYLYQKVLISTEINKLSLIHRILAKYDSIILTTDYEESLILTCFIKSSKVNEINQILEESAKNKTILTTKAEFIYK